MKLTLLAFSALISASMAVVPNAGDKAALASLFNAMGYNNYTDTDDCAAGAGNPAYECNASQRVTKITVGGWEAYTISGTLATQVGSLTELTVFNVSHLDLRGNLPSELGLLVKLSIFEIQHNEFAGTIPGTFTEFDKLDIFQVQKNKLAGHLPPGFKVNLQNTTTCKLSLGATGGDNNDFCCTDNANPDNVIPIQCDESNLFDWSEDCDSTCAPIGQVYTPAPTACTIDFTKCDTECGNRDNVETCVCQGDLTTVKCKAAVKTSAAPLLSMHVGAFVVMSLIVATLLAGALMQ